jgi:hypothetical protein
MGWLNRTIAAAAISACMTIAGVSAQDFYPDEALVGTMWASEGAFDWTSVDAAGEITHRTSDGNYLEILDVNDGIYVFMLNWWNDEAELNVIEYGVMVPSRDNSYAIIEADDRSGGGHSGIVGQGFFRILDRDTARLIQLGRLADGSAAAFSNVLNRVEAPPDVPLPENRPSQ